MSDIPADAPPSYQQATGGSSSSSSSRPAAGNHSSTSHLNVPGKSSDKNGIPAQARRSMEDEARSLPEGWVRTFDPQSNHHFYVDTRQDPPRSIWIHPYDDETYLSTLTSEERERLEQETLAHGHHSGEPSKNDIMFSHTDDEDEGEASSSRPPNRTGNSSGNIPNELPPRPDGKGKDSKPSFGRKWKDKITGTTHEEREQKRAQQAEHERQLYEQHQRVRHAMVEAERTGQPVFIGKDRDGKDVFVEPPNYSGYYNNGGYGVDPYRGGVYTTPNARYIRPANPYYRGGGYYPGGGLGYGGLALPLGLGLGGGLLLGGAIGGFGF